MMMEPAAGGTDGYRRRKPDHTMPGMEASWRIVDANLNRAREALRVAEDYARFILDDASLCSAAKSMRGELRRVEEGLPAGALLAGRDTTGDVGTVLSTEAEADRAGATGVAVAACKRLTEALRAIEEYLKVLSPGSAPAVEALRYRAYTFEQRLLGRADLTTRIRRARLYVLLTSELCRQDPVLTAHAAIAGGADVIQLREKTLPHRQFWELARRLRALTLESETLLIINDRADIAAAVGADGVHVGQDDLPVAAARRIVGGDKLVGLSTHSLEQARAAVAAGADYIGVGPMFASPTKTISPTPGPAFLKAVAAEISLPAFAIGGITAGNIGTLVDAGGRRAAVCQSVIAAEDPKSAARALKDKLPVIG